MSSLRRALADRRVAVSGALLLALALAAAAAPAIAALLGTDSHKVDLYQRLAAPSLGHPFGTDELGRDLLLRLLDAVFRAAAARAREPSAAGGTLAGVRLLLRLLAVVA